MCWPSIIIHVNCIIITMRLWFLLSLKFLLWSLNRLFKIDIKLLIHFLQYIWFSLFHCSSGAFGLISKGNIQSSMWFFFSAVLILLLWKILLGCSCLISCVHGHLTPANYYPSTYIRWQQQQQLPLIISSPSIRIIVDVIMISRNWRLLGISRLFRAPSIFNSWNSFQSSRNILPLFIFHSPLGGRFHTFRSPSLCLRNLSSSIFSTKFRNFFYCNWCYDAIFSVLFGKFVKDIPVKSVTQNGDRIEWW